MIRWGIVGTGGVSALFAEAVAETENGEVVAVASREPRSARAFADQWAIPHGWSADDMAADDQVDAVYIATPPALHWDHVLRALDAGKHVLCEKPLGSNADRAAEMAAVAEVNGLFLMEAMWCRFLPAHQRLRQLLAERYVGDVLMVDACFGIKQPNRARNEWNPALGGGALLTSGSYPLQLAQMVLGAPVNVRAGGVSGEVDEHYAAILTYASGAVAVIRNAIDSDVGNSARIMGTEGTLSLASLTNPTQIDGDRTAAPPPIDKPRLWYEVEHVHECLAAGLTESPVMPLAESVAIAQTMDDIRRQL